MGRCGILLKSRGDNMKITKFSQNLKTSFFYRIGLAVLFLLSAVLLPGRASAEDIWVYQGLDGVDYYLMPETLEYTDHWYADVKFVRDGEMKFLARFRFVPTGNVVDNQYEIAADMWWRSQSRWISMGKSPEDALARALWVDGISPIIYGTQNSGSDG